MGVVGNTGRSRRQRIALSAAVFATVATGLALAAAPASAATRSSSRHPSWAAATHFRRPAFRPKRTIEVSSVDAFWRAWRNLRPGWEIDVHHVVFSGEVILSKHLTGWAEVHFGRGTVFAGGSDISNPAVWISGSRNVRFYGGSITNPDGGGGMLIYDSSYVTWWDFDIHATGGSGLVIQGIHSANTNLDLKGEISQWGGNLALDPHTEKGTGLHGALLGDGGYGVKDSRFALDLHDGPTGSGLEAGGVDSSDGVWDNTFYVRCRNLTMQATVEAGGNCVQLWGFNVIGNHFAYLAAKNIEGRPYEAQGMREGQSLATDSVVYGHASHTNLNPLLPQTDGLPLPVLWDPRHGPTAFQHISPRD